MQKSTENPTYLANVAFECILGTVFILCSIFLLICVFRTRKTGTSKARRTKMTNIKRKITGSFNAFFSNRKQTSTHQTAASAPPPYRQIKDKIQYKTPATAQPVKGHQKMIQHSINISQQKANEPTSNSQPHSRKPSSMKRMRKKKTDNHGHRGTLVKGDQLTSKLSIDSKELHKSQAELNTGHANAATGKHNITNCVAQRLSDSVAGNNQTRKSTSCQLSSGQLPPTNMQSRESMHPQVTQSIVYPIVPFPFNDKAADHRQMMGWMPLHPHPIVNDLQTIVQPVGITTANCISNATVHSVMSDCLAKANLLMQHQRQVAACNQVTATESIDLTSTQNVYRTNTEMGPG